MQESFIEYISLYLKPKSGVLAKGEVLFQQGDQVGNIYYIKAGKIKLQRTTIEGTPVVVHVAHSGETIAEASLFSNEYHCSAIADIKTEIESFKKSELMQQLEQDPMAMKKLLVLLARQVRELRANSEIKNIHSAKERILAYIRSEMDDNKELELSLSLKDVAHKIGLAHETFYRELKKLEQAGQIIRQDRQIKLCV